MDNRQLFALMKTFGERFIFIDQDQAKQDLEVNRDQLEAAYMAMLSCQEELAKKEAAEA